MKTQAHVYRAAGMTSLLLLLLQACSGEAPAPTETATETPTAAAVVEGPVAGALTSAMFTAMGGQEALAATRNLVQQGSGIRNHLGQIPLTGGRDPQASLSELTETIDLAQGRAAFQYTVQADGGFAQQRTEVFTDYQGVPIGWGTTGGRPNIAVSPNGLFSWATHNSPDILLRRNPISIALAAAVADPDVAATEVVLDGTAYWSVPTNLQGEPIQLLFAEGTALLQGFTALDTETLRGDQNATYIYGDWRPVGALQLPHRVEIRHGDGVFADLTYDAVSVDVADDALALFTLPDDILAQADQVVAAAGEPWVALDWVDVAPGVAHIVAFSHHSMVVEFDSFVVVVEGPYTEAQSLTLARMIEQRSGKPIRYVVPTHPHHDHTGGLRGLAAAGATVLTAAGHEAEIRAIMESPHSNPPDALARALIDNGELGRLEVFSGSTDVSEGAQQLLLYEVDSIPHVKPKVLAYVPSSKVLFQSDLFFGAASPDAAALHAAIVALGLEVEQIVGGHGAVLPFGTLETAVDGSN